MKTAKKLLAITLALLTALTLMPIMQTAQAATPSVNLTRADITGDKTLDVYFSNRVNTFGAFYCAIRIVDSVESQTLVWKDGTPLQWGGTLAHAFDYGAYPSRRFFMHWTMNAAESITIGDTAVDTIAEIQALVAPGGEYEGNAVMFCIEETSGTRANGMIESIWVAGDGNKLCAATRPIETNKWDGAYVSLTEPMSLLSAFCYNDDTVVMHFSETVGKQGKDLYWASVRIVNADNSLRSDTSGYLQWGVNQGADLEYYGKVGDADYGRSLMGKISGKKLSEIEAIVEAHNADENAERWYVKMSIEEKGFAVSTMLRGNGYIDSIFSRNTVTAQPDPTGATTPAKLRANKPGSSSNNFDGVYVDLVNVTENVSVTSVRAIASDKIEITFSEPVVFDKYPKAPSFYVRLVDSGNNVMNNGSGTNFSWGGTMAATSDPSVFNFTMTDRTLGYNNLADILALTEDSGLYPDYNMRFGIGQEIETGNLLGLVDNVTSTDGERMLVSNRPSWDGSYTEITGIGTTDVTLVSAELIDDSRLLVTFSEPVTFTPVDPWMSLRLVNAKDELVWDGGSVNTGNPMQWSGSWEWVDDTHTSLIWTMGANLTNPYPVHNICDLLEYNGISSFSAYILKFGIEEVPNLPSFSISYTNGGVDNVISETFKPLNATCVSSGFRNAAYVAITAEYDTAPIALVDTAQLNENELVLTFSAPVKMTGTPFFGIRMVDKNGYLVWDGAENTGTPMQWGGSWSWYNDEHTQIKWRLNINNTFGVDNLTELLHYSAAKGLDAFSDKALKICIEETRIPSDPDFIVIKNDGLVSNVTAADSPKKLSSTLLRENYLDGAYGDITVLAGDYTPLTVTEAKVINDSQITIAFSEPVDITGNVFAGLRLVDENGLLVWDGGAEYSGTPMQWVGKWMYYSDDHSKIVWTMNGNNTYGAMCLSDVLNYAGQLADFKQYALRMCIEEGPITDGEYIRGNNLIENISAVGMDKHAEATLSRGDIARDGIYVPVVGMLPENDFALVSAEVVSDTDIIVTFSAPVNIRGDEENDVYRPFTAVRMVDENGALVWDSGEKGKGTPMQWIGRWTWENEEHTAIRWSIYSGNTYGIRNLSELLEYKGLDDFKDYTFSFCIEELGRRVVNNNGLVENITLASNDKLHLRATRAGGYDGVYVPLTGAELNKLYAGASILNDTQILIKFGTSVKIDKKNSPFIALRYLQGGSLLWNGPVNKGTPIQFYGTWEWYNSSHTAIVWTMNGGNTLGADNVYDVLYYRNACVQYEGVPIVMCIEEAGEGIVGKNGLVQNVVSYDGASHLSGTYAIWNDGRYMSLSGELPEDLLSITSVKAIDDMTLEISFSSSVEISEGEDAPSIGIRYLTKEGGTDAAIDGKLAIFPGDWEWKDESHTVMIWKLNLDKAHGARNLSEILSFTGDLRFNSGDIVSFCIYEQENDEAKGRWNYRVDSVYDLDGVRKLAATESSDFGRSQTVIEVCYDLPALEENVDEPPVKTVEKTDYTWYYVGAGALVAVGVTLGAVIGGKGKKKESR